MYEIRKRKKGTKIMRLSIRIDRGGTEDVQKK